MKVKLMYWAEGNGQLSFPFVLLTEELPLILTGERPLEVKKSERETF
jgi:hypothetical protein